MNAPIRNRFLTCIVSMSLIAAGVFMAQPAGAADDIPIRIAFPSGMNAQIVIAMERAGIPEKLGLRPYSLPSNMGRR
jgi:hypothetical protein